MNILKIPPLVSGGLILSYQCNCFCRHCLYASAPRWNDWMTEQQLEHYLRQIRQFAPNQVGLHLAGGEPLLNFELTLRAVELCIEVGVPIQYVETNASWCEDDDITSYQLYMLRESGLPAILISVSPFHNEFIPFEKTDRAIRLAREIYGPYNVLIYTGFFYSQLQDFNPQESMPFNNYLHTVGSEAAADSFIQHYGLIPNGRAASKLNFLFQKQPARAFFDQNCLAELSNPEHIHIDPYGNYIAQFCTGISLGKSGDLGQLFGGIPLQTRPLLDMLVTSGVAGLLKFAQDQFDFQPNPEGYIAKCHLCQDIRQHIVQRTDQFEELAPMEFYSYL
ncbi:MAG: radical SAM protein [candidate division KSB1 bacterium]|nr:radical SAM protein [candidate division KSB1 bacterium]MDZ7318384.1 radical SAM protein [candidate division KSB1 bacterium]MDZ7341003.1 radical SAM protein [candidate division KSB1 bacterium]